MLEGRMGDAPAFAVGDELVLGQHEVGPARDAEVRGAVAHVEHAAVQGLLLGQALALAVAAGARALRAGPGRVQAPAALAGLHQAVGDDLQMAQAMALQHMAYGVVDAVADHLHHHAVGLGGRHEAGKAGVDLDGVQVGAQLGLVHVQQRDLALHAFARADLAALPGVFQLLPAGLAEAVEQGVGHVQQADRAVEIALHHPAGRGGVQIQGNALIHGTAPLRFGPRARRRRELARRPAHTR